MQIVLGEEGKDDAGSWEVGEASAPRSPRWELIHKGLPTPAAAPLRRASGATEPTRSKKVGAPPNKKLPGKGSVTAAADASHLAQLQEWAAQA